MAIFIGGRQISGGTSPFVIAEAGVNHNGDPSIARALVDAAADAGADAVKFQTFDPDALAVANAPQAEYQRARAEAPNQRAMLAALQLPEQALRDLHRQAADRDIQFLSTPFDLVSLALLDALEVPAIKIGSGDLTNVILLRAVAATGRPILLSTGMATLDEVGRALDELRDAEVALLHCTSAYPAPDGDANLRAIPTMREAFGREVGYSDHTIGATTALAAVALGATMIEKHLTLDRTMDGPDHAASAEPASFAAMVREIRVVHEALGNGIKQPRPIEEDALRVARRSVVTARDLEAGHRIGAHDLTVKRPGTGISPFDLDSILGRTTMRALPADHTLGWDDLSDRAERP